eukprot:2838865-Amphidinium_carterae.1
MKTAEFGQPCIPGLSASRVYVVLRNVMHVFCPFLGQCKQRCRLNLIWPNGNLQSLRTQSTKAPSMPSRCMVFHIAGPRRQSCIVPFKPRDYTTRSREIPHNLIGAATY